MKKYLFVALLTSACATYTPPVVVTPTPPPVERTSFCVAPYVRDAQNRPIMDATVSIATGPSLQTNRDGYAYLYPVEVGERELLVTKPGYVDYRRAVTIGSLACDTTVTLVAARPPPRVLPRIVTRGQFFGTADGGRFTAIGASDFNIYARFLAGEDIEPILEQRAAAGFNTLRVWTWYDGPPIFVQQIGRLVPSEHPDFYPRLSEFSSRLSAYGLYVEFLAYAGGSRGDHWERLGAALQGVTNVLGVELINEADSYSHDIRPLEFSRLPGILTSRGSNGSEHAPVGFVWYPRTPPTPENPGEFRPDHVWDYTTFHTNGSYQEFRKVGHNAWELWSGPSFTNETSRYPDVGMWRGESLARQQKLAYSSAAGAALLAAGSLFHSVEGKTSTLWGADALAVATAWAAGARSVPLACQDGHYRHRDDLEVTDAGQTGERVYQRGYDAACIVYVHP